MARRKFPAYVEPLPSRERVRLRNSSQLDGNKGQRNWKAKVGEGNHRSLGFSLRFSFRFVSSRHVRSRYRKKKMACGCQLRERMEGSIDRFWSDYERIRSCLLLHDPGLYIYIIGYDTIYLCCLILWVKGVSDCVLRIEKFISQARASRARTNDNYVIVVPLGSIVERRRNTYTVSSFIASCNKPIERRNVLAWKIFSMRVHFSFFYRYWQFSTLLINCFLQSRKSFRLYLFIFSSLCK